MSGRREALAIAPTDALLVALGGGAGGAARHLLAAWVGSLSGHPQIFTIVGINLIGGIAAGIGLRLLAAQSRRFLVLLPGFLGGFTTFSAWGHASAELVARGHLDTAAWGAVGALLVGLCAAWMVPRGRAARRS